MPALGKCLNILDDRIEDEEFEREFVRRLLPQWESNRAEARALVTDFEEQMSPQRLVNLPPLNRLDPNTRGWIGQLVHELWLVRYPVRKWAADVLACVEGVEAQYGQIIHRIGRHDIPPLLAELRTMRGDFAEFRTRCQELGRSIGELPNEAKVT